MTPSPRANGGAKPQRETSAGGVVFRHDGPRTLVLLIRDAHRTWGFPKGHVEAGETASDAAEREVREETGLDRIDLIAPVCTIDWSFRFRGRLIHKTCHFFAIETNERRTRPLRSEGIVACRWATVEQGAKLLTHDNARGVLLAAGEMITTRRPARPLLTVATP